MSTKRSRVRESLRARGLRLEELGDGVGAVLGGRRVAERPDEARGQAAA
jgi:hypothetical protein